MKYQFVKAIEEYIPTPEDMGKVTTLEYKKPINQQPMCWFEKNDPKSIDLFINHQHHFFEDDGKLCAILNMTYIFSIYGEYDVNPKEDLGKMFNKAALKMAEKQKEISERHFELLPLLPPIASLLADLAEKSKPEISSQ